MVTIQDCTVAASELTTGKAPSLKLALWAAILSCQKPLDQNGAQLDALRPFVRRALPSYEPKVLAAYIRKRAPGMVTVSNAKSIILVDERHRNGELAHLEAMPSSLREWVRWRDEVARMHGLSWKTASFAALLMWPFECPFVPVDSHVCKRLSLFSIYQSGILSKKTKTGRAIYREIERLVMNEWREAGQPCALAVWHWFKWEQHRQMVGASKSSACESHLLLSARSY